MDNTAETPETQQNDVLDAGLDDPAADLGEQDIQPAANGEQPETPEGGPEGSAGEGDTDDELTLQFGDEAPPASASQEQQNAPQWVKDLRKQYAEAQRKLREFEAKEKTQQQSQQTQPPTLGPKPKLEEFDYDEGKFDDALGKWYDAKRQVDAAEAEKRQAAEARQRAIQERQEGYIKEARELRVKDYQDAETEVVAALSVEQQGILLAGADKPALLVYALGRNPTKLQPLAQIKDPVRFAFAAAKLEKELKVTSARTVNKPAPEGRISSSSGTPAAGGGERKLEQLRAEAEKTGDYSKVLAYKQQLKRAQNQRK
ncbi:hypothetical protein [Burkholderia mayonis]|uniref:Scaffolding protein n=1 Tax=Burkholderia mayonis TaxID=1385591 RepID=A0A1B4G337_9BURK|nr:hypothetical protein [Burkholderia mayonis]AOJ10347.1 hypothetical protein WS71_24365 [Burkholderia mayonis]KVE53671.1 hypothetical protein WS71_06405 [Burkholderia mayonis]